MVRLIPMTENEFRAYLASSIPDYAHEMIRSGAWPEDRAQQLAEAQFRTLLPDGLKTPNAFVWNIADDDTGEKVGILWFAIREDFGDRRGFVYDVQVFDQFRRRGYARRALLALENRARELGITSVALNVFVHNAPARALYEQLGYTERAIIMAKDLGAGNSGPT